MSGINKKSLQSLIKTEIDLLKLAKDKTYDFYTQGEELIAKNLSKDELLKIYDKYDGIIIPSKSNSENLFEPSNDSLIEQEYQEFKQFVIKKYKLIISEQFQINELGGWLKDRMSFIKDIAETLKLKLGELIKLFTNSKVYKFFAKIGWNLTKLFDLIKKGFGYYKLLLNKISEFMSKNKISKWTEEKLKQLDKFLSSNPTLKKIAGIGVAALLIYIWFHMSFTGDMSYDFDMSTVLQALGGTFTLHTLFAGKEGTKLLLLLTTGLIGLSFPWPGPSSIKFISAMIVSLAKTIKNKIHGAKIIKTS